MRSVCRLALAAAAVDGDGAFHVCSAQSARSRQRRPPQAAAREAPAEPEAGTEAGAEPRSTKRPSSSPPRKTEEKLINAPATMTVIDPQTIQSAPTQNFAELLRAVPGVNITQVSARDINITARAARPARWRPAARAARRPQPLSGFLRVRHVGLPAGEPERDQADRSDSRPGVRRLGRQRAQRRGQRDHQVAARDAGDERHRWASAASIARPTAPARRARARSSTSAARTRRRSTIAWRTSCRPAAIRRIPYGAARPAPSRATVPRSAPRPRKDYPAVHQPGHDAAEVRRARRLRLPGRPRSCRSRAASPAPTASCTPASARSTSTTAR